MKADQVYGMLKNNIKKTDNKTQQEFDALYASMKTTVISDNGNEIEIENCIAPSRVMNITINGRTSLFKRTKGSNEEWVELGINTIRDIETYEYRLDNTKAVIDINNKTYSLLNTNNDIIQLYGVGNVSDTLVRNIDGDIICNQAIKKYTFSGSEYWNYVTIYGDVARFDFTPSFSTSKALNGIYSNLFPTGVISTQNKECINLHSQINSIQLQIKTSRLSEATLEGLQEWLRENPLTIYCQLEESVDINIETQPLQIPISSSANTISVGDGVQASEFSITIPIDKISKLEQDIISLQNAISLLQS